MMANSRVHAERLFQVFPETASMQIFNEINRVLKSKGRLVLVDMDIATLSVNFSNSAFERKVINHFALKLRPNGFAGRQIFEILKKNNYKELSLEFIHHSIGNLTSTYFSEWIIKGALDAKVVTKEEADKWRHELTRKTEEGTFLAYLSNILVTGIKP